MGPYEAATLAQEAERPQPAQPSEWEAWRAEIRTFCAGTRAELGALARSLTRDRLDPLPEPDTASVRGVPSAETHCQQDTADRLEKLKQQIANRLQGEANRPAGDAPERPDMPSAAGPRVDT